MFDAIFGRSVKILKILAKVQCVLAFVLASMLCGAVHEMLKPFSRFSAIVLGLVVAVVFWVLQMFLAWALYAFAELVEYTKETHKELSNMSEGLARYTQATYEELHSMNKGLEAYTKAMGKTILLVEQNALKALSVADNAYVLEQGRITKSGPGKELLKDPAIAEAYLGKAAR